MVGAAAVQLGPLPGTGAHYVAPPPSSLELRKLRYAGVPWCGLVEGRASTCGYEKAPPACFYEAKVNLTSLELHLSAR